MRTNGSAFNLKTIPHSCPLNVKHFWCRAQSQQHHQYTRVSLQRVWTQKPQGQLQEQPVPFGTGLNTSIISGWTLKRSDTQSSDTDQHTLHLGALAELMLEGCKSPVAISCMKNTAASTSPLLSTQRSHSNWYCPPIKLKQNPKTACVVLTLVTIPLLAWGNFGSCSWQRQLSLPLPAQTWSNISSSLYNSFNALSQPQQLTSAPQTPKSPEIAFFTYTMYRHTHTSQLQETGRLSEFLKS